MNSLTGWEGAIQMVRQSVNPSHMLASVANGIDSDLLQEIIDQPYLSPIGEIIRL